MISNSPFHGKLLTESGVIVPFRLMVPEALEGESTGPTVNSPGSKNPRLGRPLHRISHGPRRCWKNLNDRHLTDPPGMNEKHQIWSSRGCKPFNLESVQNPYINKRVQVFVIQVRDTRRFFLALLVAFSPFIEKGSVPVLSLEQGQKGQQQSPTHPKTIYPGHKAAGAPGP